MTEAAEEAKESGRVEALDGRRRRTRLTDLRRDSGNKRAVVEEDVTTRGRGGTAEEEKDRVVRGLAARSRTKRNVDSLKEGVGCLPNGRGVGEDPQVASARRAEEDNVGLKLDGVSGGTVDERRAGADDARAQPQDMELGFGWTRNSPPKSATKTVATSASCSRVGEVFDGSEGGIVEGRAVSEKVERAH